MGDGSLDERSERLASRVGALAAALAAGGVSEEVSARVLAHASAAVLQALALDELLAEPSAARVVTAAPVAEPDATAEPGVPLAA